MGDARDPLLNRNFRLQHTQGLLFFESENLENLRTPLLGISVGMEAARAVAGYIGQSHEPGR